MSKMSVHLVTWNGAKYVPYLFESLRNQTFKDWELLVIDNDSKDATVELIKKELENFVIPFRVVQNQKNIGFAPGHNQAVQLTNAPYFQLLNQDMYLAPDYFEKVVAMMDARSDAGAGQGLLLRWDFGKQDRTNIVDTMGLKVFRSRRVVDWCTGQLTNQLIDQLTNQQTIEVFGVSGALPIYRRKAVEQVMFPAKGGSASGGEGQMFDEDFFMYKEDVDLAFRLRAQGWKAFVVPTAKAWHDRTAAGPRDLSDRSILKNRKTKSAFINYHSYKNHLMILLKNEHCVNLSKDWLWIFWYEFRKLVFLLLTDWKTLKGISEVWHLWPRLIQKRKQIMNNYKVRPEEIRKWFIDSRMPESSRIFPNNS